MDILLVSSGLCCVILGIFGSFLPIIPGPPLSWMGLLLLYFTDAVPTNYWMLGITLVIAIIITILSYVIPAKGTKRYGGSSYGVWGTNIGLVVGIFAPIPFGFVIGPFVGAFIGEMIYNANDHQRAFKAATGSFIGFLASTLISFMVSMSFLGLFLVIVWNNRMGLF